MFTREQRMHLDNLPVDKRNRQEIKIKIAIFTLNLKRKLICILFANFVNIYFFFFFLISCQISIYNSATAKIIKNMKIAPVVP